MQEQNDIRIEYKHNEETPPKEILFSAIEYIVKQIEHRGFKFYKSKMEIIKRVQDIEFAILFWGSDSNGKGYRSRVTVNCSIKNRKFDEFYFGGHLAEGCWKEWELYGKENYELSVKDIIQILDNYFLPLTERFVNDIDNLVNDVVEKGVYPNNEKEGYVISLDFLKRYGNIGQLEKAIQKYYDVDISRYPVNNQRFKDVLLDIRNGKTREEFTPDIEIAQAIVENDLKIKLKE